MSINKYIKKPCIIEAVMWDGSIQSTREVLEFMGQTVNTNDKLSEEKFDDYVFICNKEGLKINTLEGVMLASVGDYIIKGVHSEFYPCKPDIFSETYDFV